MDEEIKEILEYLKNDKIEKPFGMATIDKKRLLNYITNLQKENQSLKEKLNCKEYFSSTMPENTEFVILTKENYDKQQKDLALENIILKSRNEKAIEFIKDSGITFLNLANQRCFCNNNCADEILNILQGGDE